MACQGITDILNRETGRFLPGTIFGRMFGKSILPSLIRRGVYPAGLSETINLLNYERNAPDEADPEWTAVTVVDGQEGGACLPNADVIEIGSTTRNFQLKRKALWGPPFCAEEFRSVFELRSQLDQITEIIAQRVRIEWELRDLNEYFRTVQYKVVVDDCSNPTTTSTAAATYPSACPAQTMGVGLLEKYRIKLIRDGAADSALVRSNGRPLLTILASEETIGNLIRQNSTAREDVRFADEGMGQNARLVQGFGINHSYGGFIYIALMFPRRFSCTDGTYTQIPPFIRSAATKGFKYDVNPAWEAAAYEETLIFDPEVMIQLVPQPITNPAPKFQFDPVSYVGDIKISNIPNETCNPDGNILKHRIVMAAATQPRFPWRGAAFVHLRCDPPCLNATTCTT